MLVVNLQALEDSQVVGVVCQKGKVEESLYEMCEMLYQIMKNDEMRAIFSEATEMVQMKFADETK